jgi:hypothetical protein
VTEKTIPVDVEWALQGKTLGRAGARVLACSNDKLSMENFTELLGRFSLGTPDRLPQVSVSYLTSGTGPERVYYLGMAIHKWASDMQTDGGELLERDDDKRPVAVTTYFCAPYQPLAAAAVSYQAMYTELDKIRLGATSGPPRHVDFPVRTGLLPIDSLAMQSAGRLLTGPVCVLGAESATVAERLDFIEAVAALLPYGHRTRLTAATWVRSTHRDHRFRLYFSNTARDNHPDHVVYWERSELTSLTPHDDYAYTYDRWLTDTVGQLAALARLTTPRSFSRHEVLESLDKIGVHRPEPTERPRYRPVPRILALPPARQDAKLDGEQILRECAAFIRRPHRPELNTAIIRLRALARSGTRPEELDRYREIIREYQLFQHDEALGSYEPKLREALFKVAFVPPLSYPDYCLIEDSLGDKSPDQALLRMITDAGMSDRDIQIRAVVYGQLLPESEKDTKRKLDHWYALAEVNAAQLINAMADHWHQPWHALHASRIATDFVSRKDCGSPGAIRTVLQYHSFLANLLQALGDDSFQLSVLTRFLRAAYPNGPGRSDIQQILAKNAEPPSPALLAAVLLYLPDDAYLTRIAQQAYIFRTIQAMDLTPDIIQAMESRLASANRRPGGPAAELERDHVTDRS